MLLCRPSLPRLAPSAPSSTPAPITLYVYGQNFNTGATVQFKGTNLAITNQSSTYLQTSIPASLLTATGPVSVTVTNPAPSAAISTSFIFTVLPVPVATISTISPASVTAGASAVSLTVNGSAFVSGSTIQVNGTALTTNYLGSSSLYATVPDALVAAAGSDAITVVSPGASGPVTSNSVTLTVNPLPAGEFIVNQLANDLVWDPQHSVIYASVPSSAAQNGNSVVAINPTTGAITASVYAGSEPDLLAISDDGNYLYVAPDGSSNVQRILLPSMKLDVLVSLGASSFYGPNTALALDVAPATPHTWMASVGNINVSPAAQEGITVFDDGVARPLSAGRNGSHGGFDLLLGTAVWGANSSSIYGANNESTGFDFYVVPVTSSGVLGTSIKDYSGAVSGFGGRIHFDKTTGYIFADNGPVLNPANGTAVGTFSTSGTMVPDGALGKAFFLGSQYGSIPVGTLNSYSTSKFTPLSTLVFPNVSGSPTRLIRWGTNGLAFNGNTTNYSGSTTTKTGKIYLYSGSFVQ